ncbi:MAG: hypothetical protein EBX41_08340, partial [Chitinophagia bacterium]|nr:hypothetical protein [Chitinophagia bacterium]
AQKEFSNSFVQHQPLKGYVIQRIGYLHGWYFWAKLAKKSMIGDFERMIDYVNLIVTIDHYQRFLRVYGLGIRLYAIFIFPFLL